MGFSFGINPNIMKECFYFFGAKLQFDFDVEIFTKRIFYNMQKIYRLFYRPSGVVFSMSLKPRTFVFLPLFRRTVVGRYDENLNFLLFFSTNHNTARHNHCQGVLKSSFSEKATKI